MLLYKNIIIESEISKQVLRSITEKTKIDYKNLKLEYLKKEIIKLKKDYEKKKKIHSDNLTYKYEIFWNIVEEKYNKKR